MVEKFNPRKFSKEQRVKQRTRAKYEINISLRCVQKRETKREQYAANFVARIFRQTLTGFRQFIRYVKGKVGFYSITEPLLSTTVRNKYKTLKYRSPTSAVFFLHYFPTPLVLFDKTTISLSDKKLKNSPFLKFRKTFFANLTSVAAFSKFQQSFTLLTYHKLRSFQLDVFCWKVEFFFLLFQFFPFHFTFL